MVEDNCGVVQVAPEPTTVVPWELEYHVTVAVFVEAVKVAVCSQLTVWLETVGVAGTAKNEKTPALVAVPEAFTT